MKNAPLTLILVDDHSVLRHGLRNALEQKKNIRILGECDNGRDAVGLVEKMCPKVIIMDINMPELNGIETTRQIMAKCPDTKIIALSMLCDESSVMQMLDAGAKGFFMKTCSLEELYDAIQQVAAGKTALCEQAREIVVENALNPTEKRSPVFRLTPREREILQLIAEGFTSKEIADKLSVTKRTVDIHRTNLTQKLNIKTIAGLTRFAVREGIVPA